MTIAILRLPEYRVCFLTKLQSLIKNTVLAENAGLEDLTPSTSTPSFLDKYIDPSLSEDVTYAQSFNRVELIHLFSEKHVISSRVADNGNSTVMAPQTHSDASESLYGIEEDQPSTRSDVSVEERDLDIKRIVIVSCMTNSCSSYNPSCLRDSVRSNNLS